MGKQKHDIGYQKRRKRDIKQRKLQQTDLRNYSDKREPTKWGKRNKT